MPTRSQLTVNVLCMLGIELSVSLYFYVHFAVTDTALCAACSVNVTAECIGNKGTDRP
jgi:hypothetical protein